MTENKLLAESTFVVVDVETTGLNPSEDRITEIPMMKLKNGILEDEFSTLINPLVSSEPVIRQGCTETGFS